MTNSKTRNSGRRSPRTSLALLAAGGLAVALASGSSKAEWPPPPSATAADMSDPAKYWPNDPGYGGLWQYFSFIPTVKGKTPKVVTGETASGMSVDLAWRHTVGDNRVRIAVLDSGIKWDARDLLDRAHLNQGELAKFKPQQADGTACGEPDTDEAFDCNGDGIFSISDYASDARVTDANHNGVRDAGDLLHGAFADGLDDDGNGHTDDISGWDFLKNDNDPYDDTRYGHGTGEANDSVASANNGIDDAGICPTCRFMPLRVGDSFIADVQDFAKAVTYATDNGASVIQEALGTIDNSQFAQQALDYAWSKNVIVIASMADENARHHNMPGTSNHTLPVHAIVFDGPEVESSTSFLGFNNCTNFGAQNFLSASGEGCSSEATGRLSGIAGLVQSMGLKAGYVDENRLTSGEIMQLLMTTADDIDVARSRDPLHSKGFYWSQDGFDQRFGYGRVNANSALQAIADGKLPPDIDVVSPRWFEVLNPSRTTGTVALEGRVSARRATSFDMWVEWAPGVEPLDALFKELPGSRVMNAPSSSVLGADGTPLAQLDLATLDPTHEPDADSPMGENKYTITVRVRSVAHYGGAIGDVRGELRRAYAIADDPDLLPGFPVRIGGSGEGSPKLADLDGDGVRDIVVPTGDGLIHVYSLASGKPVELKGFPAKAKLLDGFETAAESYRNAPAYRPGTGSGIDLDLTREAVPSTPAVADLDGDGKLEIVATSWQGTVHVFRNDGTDYTGWPRRLPEVPSCPLDGSKVPADKLCMGERDGLYHRLARGAFAAPVVVNMDADPALEIIQAAFDGYVHIFNLDGTEVSGWPVRVTTGKDAKEFGRILTTPAVADYNGDGVMDLMVGSNERVGGDDGAAGYVFMLDGRGTKAGASAFLPNWPVSVSSLSLFPLIAEGIGSSPISADVDGDGRPEGIAHGNGSPPIIMPANPGTQSVIGSIPSRALPLRSEDGEERRGLEPTSRFGAGTKARKDTLLPLFAQPSAGDLDQDGTPDVVTSGGSLSLAGSMLGRSAPAQRPQHLLGMWSGKTGAMFPGSPVLLEDFTFFNSQVIADLTGDGYPEVITGTGSYYVHAVDACGNEAAGWPKFTGQWIVATAAVGDVNGDHQLDVIASTRSGWLYAWKTAGRDDGVVQWESFHHDNRNTGNLSVPLEQGTLRGTAAPLTINAETGLCATSGSGDVTDAAIEPADEASCGCAVPGAGRFSAWYGLALGLLPAALLLRRRSRRS